MSSISERAMGITEMPERERPLSEKFRVAGADYIRARTEYRKLDKLKDTVFSRMRKDLVDASAEAGVRMTNADAERVITGSLDWETYLLRMIEAEEKMDFLKLERDAIEMRHREWQTESADARAERSMGRQAP